MKFTWYALILVLVLFALSCQQDQLIITPKTQEHASGKMVLAVSETPAGITNVVATISRQGYDTMFVDMAVSDSERSASATIQDIAVGVWHLKVEARDESNITRYVGETDVTILPGETTTADLELLPATGTLEIHVTWGPAVNILSGLVLYYPFNGSLSDSSGNGNNGSSSNPSYGTDHWGHAGSAYQFDGIDNYIIVPNAPSLNPVNQLTISFWLRVDSVVSNYMDILVKGGPVFGYFANREYALYTKQHTGRYYYLELKSAGDSLGQHELNSQAHLPGEWVFATSVVDRVNHIMQFYENGVATESIDDSYSTFNVNDDSLIIGWSEENLYQHTPLLGAMDNLRIYNRALKPAEIQLLYTLHE